MRQGKVKWYNGKKCFGFITPDAPNADGNTDDVFVHSSALKAAGIRFLNENDIVEFEEEVRNGTSPRNRRPQTARGKNNPPRFCVLEKILIKNGASPRFLLDNRA